MQKKLLIIPHLILVLTLGIAKAQCPCERIESEVSLFSTIGTSSNQSFWITHNRYGIFDDISPNAVVLPTAHLGVRSERTFDLGGGIGLLGRASGESTAYLHEAYLEAKLGFIHLNMGRRAKQPGILLNDLSSGSMFISSNAVPVPRVELSVPDFYEVPFTFGWLEFRGHFSHGLLNDPGYVKAPYLHDKSAHIQTGGNTGLKLYWGISHAAIWGGETERHEELPSGFSDFLKVIVAKGGGEGAPLGEQINALGFHTGVWDFGLKLNVRDRGLHLYYQHIFTDNSGKNFRNEYDGLWGAEIRNPFLGRWITDILYEFLYTKHQSGPGLSDPEPNDTPPFCEEQNCGFPFGGRDNYYNNGIYRAGHSYYGMSMGSPFFLTKEQLDRAYPNVSTYSSTFFISSRNIAHHVGVKGIISDRVTYRFLTSYVQYFGTYPGLNLGQTWGYFNPANNPEDYFFNPAQHQWYFMLETHWRPSKLENIQFNTTLAADRGNLFNSFGVLVGVSWTFGTLND